MLLCKCYIIKGIAAHQSFDLGRRALQSEATISCSICVGMPCCGIAYRSKGGGMEARRERVGRQEDAEEEEVRKERNGRREEGRG